MTLFNHLSTR